jgi:hypothetical protein
MMSNEGRRALSSDLYYPTLGPGYLSAPAVPGKACLVRGRAELSRPPCTHAEIHHV